MRSPRLPLFLAAALAAACGGYAGDSTPLVDEPLAAEESEPARGDFDSGFGGFSEEGSVEEDWMPEPAGAADPHEIVSPLDEPVAKPTVIVLDPKQARYFELQPDRLIIPVAGHEDLVVVDAGWVLVAEYLFSRKVEAASRVGDFWVFETVEAQPTDVLYRGSIRFDGEFAATFDPETGEYSFFDERDDPFGDAYDPTWRDFELQMPVEAGPGAASEGGFGTMEQGVEWNVNDLQVNAEMSLGTIKIAQGTREASYKPKARVTFRPLFQLHLDVNWRWSGPYVNYFKMYAEGTLEFMVGMEFKAQRAFKVDKEWLLAGQTYTKRDGTVVRPLWATLPCWTSPRVLVAGVPFWAKICPNATFKIEAELYGELSVNAEVTATKTIGGGVRYDDGIGPRLLVNNPPTTINKVLDINATLGFKAAVSVEPGADILLWSLAGPLVKFPIGVQYKMECSPPTSVAKLESFIAGKAGVKVSPPAGLPTLSWGGELFKWPTELWRRDGRCSRGFATLSYSRIRANPDTTRTLDLDMVIEVPAGSGEPAQSVSLAPELGVDGVETGYPFVFFNSSNCAACTETAQFSYFLPGTYNLWVYDYENSSQAQAKMAEARAKVVINVGNGNQECRAPGGTYNKWIAATVTVDSDHRATATCSTGTSSVNLYP